MISENLSNIFEKLKFKIQVHRNQTSEQIMDVVKLAAHNTDHTLYDCFICCIMSHGTEGHIYGTDGVLVDIPTITNNFNGQNCSQLRGKPKLFFIEACQGKRKDVGVQVDSASDDETPSFLPDKADFLVAMATPPGYVAYLDNEGSYFMTKLVMMLEKYCDKYVYISFAISGNFFQSNLGS
jgi:hypothetical protein